MSTNEIKRRIGRSEKTTGGGGGPPQYIAIRSTAASVALVPEANLPVPEDDGVPLGRLTSRDKLVVLTSGDGAVTVRDIAKRIGCPPGGKRRGRCFPGRPYLPQTTPWTRMKLPCSNTWNV
jgi:hypothetical protein